MTPAHLHHLATALQQAASAATALANGMRHDGATLDPQPAVLALGAALREMDAVRDAITQPQPSKEPHV